MTDAAARLQHLAALMRPEFDLNHVVAYGQSLAMGFEGWPALSLTQPHDSLMFGASVRPASLVKPEFQPIGGPAFRPLVATVQSEEGALLSPEAVAALPQGDIAPGETVLEGAVNFWRGRMLAGGATAGRQRLLASAAGVGGQPIEKLSKGARPELYNRFRGCLTQSKAAADAAGLSYGVAALLFLQGESNALGADGGTSDRGAYLALLSALHRDMLAEVREATGQPAPPALLCSQTGGLYANEANSIAQAQLDFALNTAGVFMAAPSYPVTNKGGHLDANGYRWLGLQFGKVLHRVLTLRQDWLPLHPIGAVLTNRRLRIKFHVPAPPLAWDRPFNGQTYTDPPDLGFAVRDARGEIALAAIEQPAPDEIELQLARDNAGPVTLHYADRTRGGRGGLRDSDGEVAPDPYVYDPNTGHYPNADHAELNGKPYKLHNWCVAFAIPVRVRISAPRMPGAPAPARRAAPPAAAPAAPAPAAPASAASPATEAAPPAGPRVTAWDALRLLQTEVTGERVKPRGWFARLFGRREQPVLRPVRPPAEAPESAPMPEAPTSGFSGIAELEYAEAASPQKFGRAGVHERLALVPAEPPPPQRPAYDAAALPPDFLAEHNREAPPGPVACYAVAEGVLWSTGLVTFGRRFVVPEDVMPSHFRGLLSPTAPPLAPIHAGALGREDVRTITLDRPVAVATHPNLGYGQTLLEVLPRLWLAWRLQELGAGIPLTLSRTAPPFLLAWVRLLHAEADIVW